LAFGQPVVPGASADGTGDGTVNAADYVVWRKNLVPSPGAATLAASAAAVSESNRVEEISDVASGSNVEATSVTETNAATSIASIIARIAPQSTYVGPAVISTQPQSAPNKVRAAETTAFSTARELTDRVNLTELAVADLTEPIETIEEHLAAHEWTKRKPDIDDSLQDTDIDESPALALSPFGRGVE
jgi:hypothetical protein